MEPCVSAHQLDWILVIVYYWCVEKKERKEEEEEEKEENEPRKERRKSSLLESRIGRVKVSNDAHVIGIGFDWFRIYGIWKSALLCLYGIGWAPRTGKILAHSVRPRGVWLFDCRRVIIEEDLWSRVRRCHFSCLRRVERRVVTAPIRRPWKLPCHPYNLVCPHPHHILPQVSVSAIVKVRHEGQERQLSWRREVDPYT